MNASLILWVSPLIIKGKVMYGSSNDTEKSIEKKTFINKQT